jgi:DNA-binding MarR family transcriptional regulator
MIMETDREVCLMVAELAKRIDDHLRSHLHGMNLTVSQAVALRELKTPLTMRELAHRMGCEASNVTFVIDKLEDGGLVDRVPHPGDRRVKRVRLTTDGRTIRTRLMRQLTKDSPLDPLNAEERQRLQDLLVKAVRT